MRECDDHLGGGNGSHANSHLLRALSQVPGCPLLLLPASATPVPDEDETKSILSGQLFALSHCFDTEDLSGSQQGLSLRLDTWPVIKETAVKRKL